MSSADIEHFRERAAEARKFADLAIDTCSKNLLYEVAEDFEARVSKLEALNGQGHLPA